MPIVAKEKAQIIERLHLDEAPNRCQASCNFFWRRKLPSLSRYKKGITNHTGDLSLSQAFVVDIDNRKDLVKLVKTIDELNKSRIKRGLPLITMRVAAGGHTDSAGNPIKNSDTWSLTPGIEGDVVIRLTGNEFCSQSQSADDKKKNVVSTGPNIAVGDFHEVIEKHYGLVLETASLIPWVTVGGLIGNPCHGTGRNAKAMAGYVEELEILKPNGEFVTINREHPDFDSIVGSNFGLFGIITNLKLRCIPAKKLEVTQTAFNFYDLIEDLKKNGTNGFLASPYANVMWIPTYRSNETEADCQKNIRVIQMSPVDLEKKDENFPPKGLNSPCAQEFMVDANDNLHISDLLSVAPDLIPFYMRHIVAKVEVDGATEHSVGNWPAQWHFQTAYPADKLVDDDFEFAIKLKEEKSDPNVGPVGPLKLVKFLENVSELLKQYPPSIMDAIYIRFNKGFNGGLNPGVCGEDELVVAFDIVSSPKIAAYAGFRAAFQKMALEFGARPHPGKFLPANINYANMYGENYTKYCEALKKWYPIEKNPFVNGMMKTILKDGIEFKNACAHEAKSETPKASSSVSHEQVCLLAKRHMENVQEGAHAHMDEWKRQLQNVDARFAPQPEDKPGIARVRI
jgi:hypothetical protein